MSMILECLCGEKVIMTTVMDGKKAGFYLNDEIETKITIGKQEVGATLYKMGCDKCSKYVIHFDKNSIIGFWNRLCLLGSGKLKISSSCSEIESNRMEMGLCPKCGSSNIYKNRGFIDIDSKTQQAMICSEESYKIFKETGKMSVGVMLAFISVRGNMYLDIDIDDKCNICSHEITPFDKDWIKMICVLEECGAERSQYTNEELAL